MSYIPPSCFDFTMENSGIPVWYGGRTVLGQSPSQPRTVHGDKDVQVMPPSGTLLPYYEFLDTRYDTPPSGWNGPV